MRVLVAGGAGFVGSHVCDTLIARGHHVTCVDNLLTGSRRNITHLEGHPSFDFVEQDVTHTPRIDVEVILHLASPASPIDYDRLPLETMAANSLGTWRLLDIAAETGARLTYASTSEVYGDPLVHPQPESYWGNVDPIGPRSCYDESKRFGEALIFAARQSRGVRANIVRIFNTYGPRMRPDDGRVIPEMLSAAIEDRALVLHGDGNQTRSFCYVDDLVEGLLHVALDPLADGEVFNLGNPAEITMRELADAIREIVRPDARLVHVDPRPGDPGRRRPIITRMQERYGWSPRVSLDDGLRRTTEAFQKDATRLAVTA